MRARPLFSVRVTWTKVMIWQVFSLYLKPPLFPFFLPLLRFLVITIGCANTVIISHGHSGRIDPVAAVYGPLRERRRGESSPFLLLNTAVARLFEVVDIRI